MMVRSNFSVVLLLALGLLAGREISASSTAEIIVSVPDQALAVIDRGKEIAQYRISTSKFGNGDSAGSYCTPLGVVHAQRRQTRGCEEFLIKPPGFGLTAVERDSVELREADR
jgi:hypothetical protein